jgi:hypothetical protein
VEHKLIELYCLICQIYDNHLVLKYQRLSNFKPKFSDEELLTCYFFGLMQKYHEQRAIFDYIQQHWRDCFPALPSYQAFNRRFNNLSPAFEIIIDELLIDKLPSGDLTNDSVLDSFPVMIAKGKQAKRSQIASEIADFGFCASKQIYYHGIKLHALAVRRIRKLPVPFIFSLSKSSTHDLTAFKELNCQLPSGILFADKAYSDTEIKDHLQVTGVTLLTPQKRKRNESVFQTEPLWSRFVSSFRQPIESFFKWLIVKTDFQNASRVRSTNGLLVHCFGKLAFACLLICFYS